ncbi:hypothetical protein [Streptomyces sp. NPDC005732]|uniref:hypothetical protein n=1 Tax=Streptomyces sp. NPDC005732 TaxID=3157057 RepID=UPI0033DF1C7C
MNAGLLALITSAEVLYAAACGMFGSRPGAPLWLSWPLPIWNALMGRRPQPPRPNYARIARLERELGMTEPERPMRAGRTVCLTKGCGGGTVEIRTWQGPLAASIHECETP